MVDAQAMQGESGRGADHHHRDIGSRTAALRPLCWLAEGEGDAEVAAARIVVTEIATHA
jgi:hypothetical protein